MAKDRSSPSATPPSAKGDELRILLVHGVGQPVETIDSAGDPMKWMEPWKDALKLKFKEDFPSVESGAVKVVFEAFDYHDIFAGDKPGAASDPRAFGQALVTLGWDGLQNNLPGMFRRSRGIDAVAQALRWTAAMIVRWAEEAELRSKLRARAAKRIEEFAPHVIAAHSLGSVICYDTFLNFRQTDLPAGQKVKAATGMELIRDRGFISFGSQIGNAYIRNVFGGRLQGLGPASYWFHLFNPKDKVFTAEVRLLGEDCLRDHANEKDDPKKRETWVNFFPIITEFDNPDPLDHTAVTTGAGTRGYLDHYNCRQLVWPSFFESRPRPIAGTVRRFIRSATESPDHRALLIGIDHYQRPDIPSLGGCVNDTFLMSALLQEQGFPVENIRLLHNDRATAARIHDRLDWLLDDIDPGEFRLLFFSGHGNQLESWGVGESVDRMDECLCPYDYDYNIRTAIMDDQIYDLYAQLPYDSQFVMILDCCHSGGMARSGGGRIRGLGSPLDIAHRGLIWLPERANERGMWTSRSSQDDVAQGRDLKRLREARKNLDILHSTTLPESARGESNAEQRRKYVGEQGTLRRLGRALSLRRTVGGYGSDEDKEPAMTETRGPYLPVILQACNESEVALEHQDGHVEYGAFTFVLDRVLRDLFRENARPGQSHAPFSWDKVMELAAGHLQQLGYRQSPQLLAAASQLEVTFGRGAMRRF